MKTMSQKYLHRVIWITGFSGAGKTTVGHILNQKLSALGKKVLNIDGDEIRSALDGFNSMRRFDRASRIQNALVYMEISKVLVKQCDYVIVSTISMFNEIYQLNREVFPNYLEVFLDVPQKIRSERDPKNFYKQLDQDSISNFCGQDLDVDHPIDANFIYRYQAGHTADLVVELLIERLNDHFQER